MPTTIEPIDHPMGNTCIHPQHNPPNHIFIPSGHKMVHICPNCGNRVEIFSSEPRFQFTMGLYRKMEIKNEKT